MAIARKVKAMAWKHFGGRKVRTLALRRPVIREAIAWKVIGATTEVSVAKEAARDGEQEAPDMVRPTTQVQVSRISRLNR